MEVPDGKVEFEVTGNNASIKRTIDDTTRYISQHSKQWDADAAKSAEGMESSFGKALKGIAAGFSAVAAGKALVNLGAQAINLASDLEEVQNVVDVTFGSNASQIETWAKNAGEQFGLTETMAKKFTSTLGAMMKSAGLAGPEIVNMSTDLAGLAADMASFYNLDFETAFQKIRTGISGETEPLKQLGINMSVANLEAFALKQGLSKAFNEMSQGEQIMLRYQYMMQATADAQGDFARTSDGYANSLRLMETKIDSLKTKLGTHLVEAATTATNALIGLLDEADKVIDLVFGEAPEKTVLDDFADIDLNTAQKLAEIQEVADKANVLAGVLVDLGKTNAATKLKSLADAANDLKDNSYTNWTNVLEAIEDVGGITFPKEEDADGIAKLAGALSGANLSEDKAQAWKEFLNNLADNADAVSKLTGTSAEETEEWLRGLAASIDELDPTDVNAWERLFTAFVDGMPYLKDAQGLPLLMQLDTIAEGANKLKTNSYDNWQKVLDALKGVDGLSSVLMEASSFNYVSDLAEALSNSNVTGTKAAAWQTFLQALKDNASGLTALTGMSEADTWKWLDDLANAAAKLDPNDAAAWDDLFDTFVRGLPGLKDANNVPILLQLGTMADGANKLKTNSADNWTKILGALKNADGLQDVFRDSTIADNVDDLAKALSSSNVDGTQAETWGKFLSALKDNAEVLSKYTGKSADETREWLDEIAEGVKKIKKGDLDAWDDLFTTFTNGFPNLLDANGAQVIQTLASAAPKLNLLKSSTPGLWRGILTSLQNIDGLENIFGSGTDVTKNIESLANALAGNSVDTTKAEAWKTFLSALKDNAGAVSELTGMDAEGTKKWLDTLYQSANELDPEAVDAWDRLLTMFTSGLSSTEQGQEFVNGIVAELLALGVHSQDAKAGLAALGMGEDEIAQKQQLWLLTCQQLVNTIPGLNKVINTETGEVKGGTSAIEEYIKAWQEGQEKIAMMSALEQKKQALNDRFVELPGLKLDMAVAKRRARIAMEEMQKVFDQYGARLAKDKQGNWIADTSNIYGLTAEQKKEIDDSFAAFLTLSAAADKAYDSWKLQDDALTEANEALKEYEATVNDMPDGIQEVAEAAVGMSEEVKTAMRDAATELKDTLTSLADYYERLREETARSVEGTVKGFEEIETSEDRRLKSEKDLTDQLHKLTEEMEQVDQSTEEGKKKWDEYKKKIDEVQNQIEHPTDSFGAKTANDIKKGLEDQVAFIDEYMQLMEEAKQKGFDSDMLAELADGSADSLEYLRALSDAKDIEGLNKLYREAREKRNQMTNQLTEAKADADDVYQDLVDKSQELITEIDKHEQAYGASANTVQGIVDGLNEHLSDVADTVDAIIAQIDRLSELGINTNYDGGFGSFSTGSGRTFTVPGHATGLNWVPYDGYLAALHEGEGILTAEENRIWQRFKTGSSSGTDYDALGSVMRDNVKAGGNVYLDGRTVGRVISDMQGKSYRTLERSGWQQ